MRLWIGSKGFGNFYIILDKCVGGVRVNIGLSKNVCFVILSVAWIRTNRKKILGSCRSKRKFIFFEIGSKFVNFSTLLIFNIKID